MAQANVVTMAPREAIEELVDTAHSAVAAELLARVVSQPPEFLEHLVLRLLSAMGYGGLERTGRLRRRGLGLGRRLGGIASSAR